MTNKIKTADLPTLLDSLTDGEHVKATWTYGEYVTSSEGPVHIDGDHCSCYGRIRWDDGTIAKTLTAVEVTHTDGTTVTRYDEEALHALLDSLEDGETITAEWCSEDGVMTLTGAVRTIGSLQEVCGYTTIALRWHDNGLLHSDLQYVTVHRPVVQRWERGLDE
jgi:hypothetical protein